MSLSTISLPSIYPKVQIPVISSTNTVGSVITILTQYYNPIGPGGPAILSSVIATFTGTINLVPVSIGSLVMTIASPSLSVEISAAGELILIGPGAETFSIDEGGSLIYTGP